MTNIKTFGSLCAGIEAASLVLEPMGLKPLWVSEIAPFPKHFLKEKYGYINNVGDMNDIPDKIVNKIIECPDFLCGGTPCQAFSLAGWKNGLNDSRGQLTLKYIEILNAIDEIRKTDGKNETVFFWENVEGVLKDKTNAFGCFLAGLAGLNAPIVVDKWSSAGVLHGPKRNIAWRVLDSKYFGLPQQRKRLYVLGGGKDYFPENYLFEKGEYMCDPMKKDTTYYTFTFFEEQSHYGQEQSELKKNINGNSVEVFRAYSDCLYAAYGTKWNGNAAAFNGSLFVSQNDRLRRLTPLECERLMGFPDDYTLLDGCKDTNRYQAVGNSWAVPVIRWLANRILNGFELIDLSKVRHTIVDSAELYMLNEFNMVSYDEYINASHYPYQYKLKNMIDIVDVNADERFYISVKGCAGILRRKIERNAGMNKRLEIVLRNIVQTTNTFEQ